MSGYGDQLSAWVKAKREPQADWTPHCDHSSYGSTCEKVREAADTSRQLVQLPTYAAWHAHRLEHSPHLASLYPEVHRANAAFWAKQQTEGVRTWAVPKPIQVTSAAQAQYDAAAVASGVITPGAVVAYRERGIGEILNGGAPPRNVHPGLVFEPLPEESQERASATNLQISAGPGSSDGAEVAELKLRCAREVGRVNTAEAELADTRRILEGVRRGRKSAMQDSDERGRQLEAARADIADAHEKREDAQTDYAYLHTCVEAAAAQFRAITGDFPGLSGPLVDLFKDVK